MVANVLKEFGLDAGEVVVESITQGLINKTWKVTGGQSDYVLQKINHEVFTRPFDIAHNISCISGFIRDLKPEYFFVHPVKTKHGDEMVFIPEAGYYRLFPFITNSHSLDVVATPGQAFEAAAQFGKFTAVLDDFDVKNLRPAIDSFHDLSLRYHQFLMAIERADELRLKKCADVLEYIRSCHHIVEEYDRIRKFSGFKLRVTHHDTKISNVLFDENEKGICVIDLDTVMPGFFISDVGDMMRTYLSPVSEEETDFSKIEIRPDFYFAIREGYLSEMGSLLSAAEQDCFDFSGVFVIYMQALRFITDYLNNDKYYLVRHPDHNLMRAKNQVCLLKKVLRLREYVS